MKWIEMKKELPTKDGIHFVYAKSADPEKPFMSTAWWSPKNKRWELLPTVWSKAITHWMNMPEAPIGKSSKGECS